MEEVLRNVYNYVDKYVDLSAVTKFVSEHKVAVIASSSVILYGIYFMKRPRNLPPGPIGLPFMGCTPYMSNDLGQTYNKMREKYGDIFCLWLGSNNYMVVVCGYELVKEVFVTRGAEFSDRQRSLVASILGIENNVFNMPYGEASSNQRKIISQAMRTVIMNRIDDIYAREMDKVHTYIQKHGVGNQIDLLDINTKVFVNASLEMLLNKSYAHDDKGLEQHIEEIKVWFKIFMELYALEFLPDFAKILMHSKCKKARKLTDEIWKRFEKEYNEHCDANKTGEITCIADACLSGEKRELSFETMLDNAVVFQPDTVNTTVYFSQWMFVYLLNYPEYQDRILEEIKTIKGDAPITLKDRSAMQLTEAFIMEVFRVNDASLGGMLNAPLKDNTIRGYNIPRFVKVQAFLGSLMHDPLVFPEPQLFKPERHIVNGKLVKHDAFVPFGMGKRTCLGENLVRSQIFMFFASIIQRYKITSATGKPPSTEKIIESMIETPQPFKVILQER